MTKPLWLIEWRCEGEALRALEPTDAEAAAAAPALAAYYNDPVNRRLLGNTTSLAAGDVAAFYRDLRASGGRPLLLWRNGVLVGDADLRRVDPAAGTAEFAILIGDRALQGRGLGTRFATMAHTWAFATLGLARLHVAIVAGNVASTRLFERLGYRRDDGPGARASADDADDLTMSITRAEFEAARGGAGAGPGLGVGVELVLRAREAPGGSAPTE